MKINKVILGLICSIFICSIIPANAQSIKMVEFTTKVSSATKKAVRKILKSKVDRFYKEYSYIPYLQYAFVDLNYDGKNELIVRFAETYEFRDKYNNIDTHVFAQTSKGLVQIMETRAYSIGIGIRDKSKLNQIYAYKGKNKKHFDLFGWDGKKEYKKKK